MDYKIVNKAWGLDNSNLMEPWFHCNDVEYHGTRGQAKKQALIDNDGAKLINGEDISYLTIKVKRFYKYDKILVNGKVIKRYELKRIERINRISQLPKDKFYYVQDNRNYVGNAVLWWGKGGNGYVTDLANAQKYTYDEIQLFDPRETDIIWESEHVEKAVRQFVDMQFLNRVLSI